jgi:hypothetical protein
MKVRTESGNSRGDLGRFGATGRGSGATGGVVSGRGPGAMGGNLPESEGGVTGTAGDDPPPGGEDGVGSAREAVEVGCAGSVLAAFDTGMNRDFTKKTTPKQPKTNPTQTTQKRLLPFGFDPEGISPGVGRCNRPGTVIRVSHRGQLSDEPARSSLRVNRTLQLGQFTTSLVSMRRFPKLNIGNILGCSVLTPFIIRPDLQE